MNVTSGGLDLEDSTSWMEDENITLALHLLVETVGDGGSGRLVDDTEDAHAESGTGVLGYLMLRVVEVGGDSDDGIGDGGAEVGLSGLLHLEDHG